MNKSLASFSMDLRRISSWIYEKDYALADQFIRWCYKEYKGINPRVECYDNIWDEVEKIKSLKEGREKCAERALTASIILLHKARTSFF